MPSLLRHALATLSYRAAEALRDPPPAFAEFQAGSGARTPAEILAHMGDLLDWALSLTDPPQRWHDSAPLPWDREVERFFAAIDRLDRRLASPAPPANSAEGIFQGPIADAFTHLGQISLLRRLAGSPVPGQNYFKAEITVPQI